MSAAELPAWPDDIKREGPYRVYKGVKYTAYDDGNSAETPYQTDRAEAAIARLRVAERALKTIAAQHSGVPTSGSRVDCMAAVASTALTAIGELPA